MNRLLLAMVIYMVVSCDNHTQDGRLDTNVIVASDSVEAILSSLPDTSFISVENLTYDITIFDSTTSGKIQDLSDAYSNVTGIFTFRGNSLRNAAFCGYVDSLPTDIEIDWVFKTKYDTTNLKTTETLCMVVASGHKECKRRNVGTCVRLHRKCVHY